MEKTTVLLKATQIDGDTTEIVVAMNGDAFDVAGAFTRLVKEAYEQMSKKNEALAYAAIQTLANVCGYRLVKKQEE